METPDHEPISKAAHGNWANQKNWWAPLCGLGVQKHPGDTEQTWDDSVGGLGWWVFEVTLGHKERVAGVGPEGQEPEGERDNPQFSRKGS